MKFTPHINLGDIMGEISVAAMDRPGKPPIYIAIFFVRGRMSYFVAGETTVEGFRPQWASKVTSTNPADLRAEGYKFSRDVKSALKGGETDPTFMLWRGPALVKDIKDRVSEDS